MRLLSCSAARQMVGGSCATSRRSAGPGGDLVNREERAAVRPETESPAAPVRRSPKNPASFSWCAHASWSTATGTLGALRTRRQSCSGAASVRRHPSTSVATGWGGDAAYTRRIKPAPSSARGTGARRRAYSRWRSLSVPPTGCPPRPKGFLICTRNRRRTASKTCGRSTTTRSSTPTK